MEENRSRQKTPLKPLKWYYAIGIILFIGILFTVSLRVWKINSGAAKNGNFYSTAPINSKTTNVRNNKSLVARDGDLIEFISGASEDHRLFLYIYKYTEKNNLTGLGFAVLTGLDEENRPVEKRTNVLDLDSLKLIEEKARLNNVSVYNEIIRKGSGFNPLWIFYGCIIIIFIFIIRQNTIKRKEFIKNTVGQQHYSSIKPRFEKSNVKFKDIGGLKTAKKELGEIIDFLKNRAKYIEMGCKLPKGILLVGPPGCGKTLLAKAVSQESGVPVACVSGSEFIEALVGVGAGRIRQLFSEAEKRGDGIIFIDEIDALAGQRGAGAGDSGEKEQTVNQLLSSMDGIGTAQNIIVLAATNRPDMLDSAVMRPGRFDRKIECGEPDLEERKEIILIHMKDRKIAKDVFSKLNYLSGICWSFTGAYIATMINEAAFLAVRKGKKEIGMEEMEEGRRRVFIGAAEEGKVIPTLEEKMLICAHEAGHLIASYFLENANPALEMSCIQRKSIKGYIFSPPKDKSGFIWRNQLLAELPVALSGRAAEELLFNGNYTAGYQNDFNKVHSLARSIVGQFGMDEKLGVMVLSQKSRDGMFLGRGVLSGVDNSELTKRKIDERVGAIVNSAFNDAKNIVSRNIERLLLVALSAEEKEILYKDEIERLIDLSDDQVKEELRKKNNQWVNERIEKIKLIKK